MVYAPLDLAGKTVLVTGGNRGIGLGMAQAMAAANASIAIWGRKGAANKTAMDELSGLGTGDIKAWEVDVTDEQAVIDATVDVVSTMGRIDSCFANAGAGVSASSFIEMDTDTWRVNMAVNLDGAFWTLRESVKHMVERSKAGDPGGSVVGVASLAGVEGAARNQAYAATKAALPSIIRGIAVEYGRYEIRANSILPGWIATDMTDTLQDSDVVSSKVISRVPIRRWGEPDDFGGMAIYLASDASKYHSGTTLIVDGGYSVF